MSLLKRLLRLLPWGGALLVGALFPAVLFALLENTWRLFGAAFAVTGLHALFLGAPALAAYRNSDRHRLLPVLLGGLTIGALPIGSIMIMGGDLKPGTKMMGLGLEIVAIAGAFGTLGALACWLTLFVTRQLR